MDTQDEDIDTETLQAKIDLSMSFAQDLVSSWINPKLNLPRNSGKDLEKELKEYMRRPARLGVGAPIPEIAVSSRDTARLKSQLTNRKGGKREREDDGDGSKAETKDSSDNEQESRAGAIRKKIKLDPFATLSGKKKKKKKKSEELGLPTPGPTPRSSRDSIREKEDGNRLEADEEEQAVAKELVDVGSSSASPTLSIPGKKKKKKKSHKLSVTSPLATSVLLPTAPSTPKLKADESIASIESLVTPIKQPPPATPKVIDLSSIASPLPSWARRSNNSVATIINGPILNLGSSFSPDEETDEILPDEASPKKKRKRRKKKKHPSSFTNAPDAEDGFVQAA